MINEKVTALMDELPRYHYEIIALEGLLETVQNAVIYPFIDFSFNSFRQVEPFLVRSAFTFVLALRNRRLYFWLIFLLGRSVYAGVINRRNFSGSSNRFVTPSVLCSRAVDKIMTQKCITRNTVGC